MTPEEKKIFKRYAQGRAMHMDSAQGILNLMNNYVQQNVLPTLVMPKSTEIIGWDMDILPEEGVIKLSPKFASKLILPKHVKN